jgi:hypothetical protein
MAKLDETLETGLERSEIRSEPAGLSRQDKPGGSPSLLFSEPS